MFRILLLSFLFCSLSFGEFLPFLDAFHKSWRPNPKTCVGLELFEKAYNLNHYERVEPSQEPRIPKSIHMIWFGSPLPKYYEHFIESWKKHHPDWEFKLWTDEDIDSFPLVTGDMVHRVNNYGQKSDIFRYEILNRYGGLYVDTDFFCVKPHDILHHTCDFYTGMGHQVVYNGNIGAAPGHPIIKKCLKSIAKMRNFQTTYTSIMASTGPYLFKEMILSYLKERFEGVIVYPTVYFYNLPIQFKRRFWRTRRYNVLRRYGNNEFSFAVHAWALSWTRYPSEGKRPKR